MLPLLLALSLAHTLQNIWWVFFSREFYTTPRYFAITLVCLNVRFATCITIKYSAFNESPKTIFKLVAHFYFFHLFGFQFSREYRKKSRRFMYFFLYCSALSSLQLWFSFSLHCIYSSAYLYEPLLLLCAHENMGKRWEDTKKNV